MNELTITGNLTDEPTSRPGWVGSGAVCRCLAGAGSGGADRGGSSGVRPAVAGVDGAGDRAAGSARGPGGVGGVAERLQSGERAAPGALLWAQLKAELGLAE
jgi:hypothetical protein